MNMITNPLTLSAAALALFLAGCGGSDDSPGGNPVPCPEGQTGTPPNCVPAADQGGGSTSSLGLVDALEAATMALNTSAGSGDGSALKKATDADKEAMASLGTATPAAEANPEGVKAQGVSATISAKGNEVAEARMDLQTALMTAKTRRTAAMERMADLPETDPNRRLLDAAIKAADDVIKVAELRLAATVDGTLSALVKKYEGEGNTPAERASAYAEAVERVLVATTSLTNTDLLTGDAADNVFAKGDTRTASMRTFAQIFAGDLKDVRYATLVEGSLPKGISVKDMKLAGTAIGTPGTLRPTATEDNRRNEGELQGIAGIFVYTGSAVNVPDVAVGGTFGDGWYFVPENASAVWTVKESLVDNAVVTTYESAAFLEWGMWIDGMPTADNAKLKRYIGAGTGGVAPNTADLTLTRGEDATQDKEVTYSGKATGLSARSTGTGDSEVHHSGHFTADVALTATLAAEVGTDADDTRLSGTISNFEGGSHVGSNWSLSLAPTVLTADGSFATGGSCTDLGPSCSWTAQAYGAEDAEPTGIYGGFNAKFRDGAATGLYHTTK
ncbi:MAG: hypothetical protein OXE84_10095 [Rhodobacteraceae bacterium]|nr:hypothetical protein [Paracoccaceae bacterium]MCY4326800.1 hypothetical protein [Paracoccaceae bacterium]